MWFGDRMERGTVLYIHDWLNLFGASSYQSVPQDGMQTQSTSRWMWACEHCVTYSEQTRSIHRSKKKHEVDLATVTLNGDVHSAPKRSQADHSVLHLDPKTFVMQLATHVTLCHIHN